jgi:predicted dehydrogenase
MFTQCAEIMTAVLDHPEVDVVYIPLPNGLHFEWAMKALSKGKHVLLEKPCTSNASEAEMLFQSPLLYPTAPQSQVPVLLEAFHSMFAPSWRCFMSHIDQSRVASAHATATVPGRLIPPNDIRFNYELSGGALMDVGTYCVAALRAVFGTEPQSCLDAFMTPMPDPQQRCDGEFKLTYEFPAGLSSCHDDKRRLGVAEGGLQGTLLGFRLPRIEVVHQPKVSEVDTPGGNEKIRTTVTTKVLFYNFMFPNFYHRIDIENEVVVERIKADGQERELLSKSTTVDYKKAYTFQNMNNHEPGEEYWQTYRWMLGQFVNKVRGRVPDTWVEYEDSIGQMRALDMAYEKSGMGLRPSSTAVSSTEK